MKTGPKPLTRKQAFEKLLQEAERERESVFLLKDEEVLVSAIKE